MSNRTCSFAGNANAPLTPAPQQTSSSATTPVTESSTRRRDPLSRTMGIGEIKRDHGGWYDQNVND